MRPVLFHLGPLEISSWGLLVALGFTAAWLVLRRELDRLCGHGPDAAALVVAAAIGGIVGARAYWLLEHAGEVSLGDAFAGAGFTWFGGVLGAVLAAGAVTRRLQVPLVPLLGAAAPALALGYAIGRIGCQLAGDGTYGVESDLPWAMSYPNGEVPTTERVHPTPVYESLVSFAIFGILWQTRERLGPLRTFAVYLILGGAARMAVEFIRLNESAWLGLTQPQLFSAVMMGAGFALLLTHRQASGAARIDTTVKGRAPTPS